MIDDHDDEFPFASGRYLVAAGLRPLRGPVFRMSNDHGRYRRNKLAARSERLSKYLQLDRFDDPVRSRVQRFIQSQLPATSAQVMQGEDPFDLLAMRAEEDLAVMRRSGDREWTCAIHLCAPNHWSAEQKIGKNFAELHEPVAEIESINRNARNFVDMMIRSEHGLQRSAWGIATDEQLNRHPDAPPGLPPAREFDADKPQAFVRVETQTMIGFQDVDAMLFVIRTTFLNCERLEAERRMQLISALQSMSAATLRYKGLDSYIAPLIDWLQRINV